MYLSYFGLESQPFSIVPDHRALYMSQSHREAVAHLLYALNESGGFVQLTGEVGTGKTTVSRYILANLPEDVDVALLLNPRITEKEMLELICDELGIRYARSISQKDLVNKLNEYLLKAHGNGRKTVLIIDEAQNLSREVLEQVRLLTNLETSSDKLLQIILIGQPELANTLQRHDLRQLSQRIVGRFSLTPLSKAETREYIDHRLKVAGVERPLFQRGAVNLVHQLSGGIPRLINVICDRALLGAYGQNRNTVTRGIVRDAAREVLNQNPQPGRRGFLQSAVRAIGWLVLVGALVATIVWGYFLYAARQGDAVQSAVDEVLDELRQSTSESVAGGGETDSSPIEAEATETPEPSVVDQSDAAESESESGYDNTEVVEDSMPPEDVTIVAGDASDAADAAELQAQVANPDDPDGTVTGSPDSQSAVDEPLPGGQAYDLTFRLGVPLSDPPAKDDPSGEAGG